MNLEIVVIAGILAVAGVSVLAPRIGVAAPLILVLLGISVALLPPVGAIQVDPELVLGVLLPPLLYSTAVNTPTMEFRRDFRLISAYSVILVAVTALVIGLLATQLLPDLPLGLGIALGAIISPTDAVATSVIRKAGVSQRIVTVLEGESMLNDATALVVLRSAVASIGVSITLWGVAVEFVWSVVAAGTIGYLVGRIGLWLRTRVAPVTSSVTISLVVPFLAYLPAEHLGASGLVSVVTAGLVTGHGAPRAIGAEERLTEKAVWQTIELLLESTIFLLVGLQAPTLWVDLTQNGGGLGLAASVAVVSFGAALVLRILFVSGSIALLARRGRREPQVRQRLTDIQGQLDEGQLPTPSGPVGAARVRAGRWAARATNHLDTDSAVSRWQRFVRLRLADLDYLAAERFGWREGVILVWAGMRGALTIAAAQTLPADTPHRSLLVLAATMVAVGTLMLQGSTLPWLAQRLHLTGQSQESDPVLWAELQRDLNQAGVAGLTSAAASGYPPELIERVQDRMQKASEIQDDFCPEKPEARERRNQFLQLRLDVVEFQRAELLELRDLGSYPTGMLDAAMAQLDADQIGIELHLE